METYIFYNYLKWRKDSKNTTINKLLKMPILPKLLIISLITSGIISLIALFFSEKISFAFIIIEVILGIISLFYSEKLFIDNSNQKYQDYKLYCNDLSTWLQSFDIIKKEQIAILQKRIDIIVSESKTKSVSRRETAEKWLQVLLIPIILAIANNIINSQTDLNKVIAYIISIMIIFLSIYSTTLAFVSVFSLLDNWQISKYKQFSNDLQSVIDIKFGL